MQLKTEIHVKRHKLELMRDLLEYSCKRMDGKTWIGSSRFVLNQLKEEGCDYPEYQMYEAYILHMEEKDEQAREILKKFKHQNFVRERIWNWQEYISTFAFLPDCIKTENRRQDVCAASFYRKRIVSCS